MLIFNKSQLNILKDVLEFGYMYCNENIISDYCMSKLTWIINNYGLNNVVSVVIEKEKIHLWEMLILMFKLKWMPLFNYSDEQLNF